MLMYFHHQNPKSKLKLNMMKGAEKMSNNLNEELQRMVKHAKMLEVSGPGMYTELIDRYKEMANGKDAGIAFDDMGIQTTVRERYYYGYPDDWFSAVLTELGQN